MHAEQSSWALVAFAIVMTANALRATALFYVEAGIVPQAQRAQRAHRSNRLRARGGVDRVSCHSFERCRRAEQNEGWNMRTSLTVLLLACAMAAAVPLLDVRTDSAATDNFPGWPTHHAGKPLRQLRSAPSSNDSPRTFPAVSAASATASRKS